MSAVHKIPESVLVVIHTLALEVLLLERADHPGFWQSVTGSRASPHEDLRDTARREAWEETGIDMPLERYTDWHLTQRYAIYPHWRHRYAPGVSHNTEHVYALALPARVDPRLAPLEHRAWRWLPWREAADACFSWSNARVIRELPWRVRG